MPQCDVNVAPTHTVCKTTVLLYACAFYGSYDSHLSSPFVQTEPHLYQSSRTAKKKKGRPTATAEQSQLKARSHLRVWTYRSQTVWTVWKFPPPRPQSPIASEWRWHSKRSKQTKFGKLVVNSRGPDEARASSLLPFAGSLSTSGHRRGSATGHRWLYPVGPKTVTTTRTTKRPWIAVTRDTSERVSRGEPLSSPNLHWTHTHTPFLLFSRRW